jgi:hypothetical protein
MPDLLGDGSFCIIVIHTVSLQFLHPFLSIAVAQAVRSGGKTQLPLTGCRKVSIGIEK